MRDGDLITQLQQVAVYYDYNHDVPDPVDVIIDGLLKARPEASPEQLLIAVRRAETELELLVTAANGWDLNYDITDPHWQWLERTKCHLFDLGERL